MHLASMIELVRERRMIEAFEIVEQHALALDGKQVGEIERAEFSAVDTEQRLGAAVAGDDRAGAVEQHDAVGRSFENGLAACCPFAPARPRQAAASVRHVQPPRVAWPPLAAAVSGRARFRRPRGSHAAARRMVTGRRRTARSSAAGRRPTRCWPKEAPAPHKAHRGRRPPATRADFQSGSREERAVGVEQAVEPIDQDAGRHQVEHPVSRGRRRAAARLLAASHAGCSARAGCGLVGSAYVPGQRWCEEYGSVSCCSPSNFCVRRRAISSNAWFSTALSEGIRASLAGGIGEAIAPGNGTTFCGGSTISVSACEKLSGAAGVAVADVERSERSDARGSSKEWSACGTPWSSIGAAACR